MPSEILGDLVVQLTGDYGPLVADFSAAEGKAREAGSQISSAFNAGSAGVIDLEGSIAKLSSSLDVGKLSADEFIGTLNKGIEEKFGATTAEEAAAAQGKHAEALRGAALAGDKLDEFLNANGFKSFTESTNRSQEAMRKWADEAQQVGQSASTADIGGSGLLTTLLGFAGITVGLDALKTFAVDALEAFAAVEKATIAITALSGSVGAAEAAISGLKDLAIQDALSFPSLLTAEQRMLAFGFSADKIGGALRSVADTSAATGRSFDAVSASFERITESGVVQSRALIQLGINMKDLSVAMGVTEGEAKKAFAALDQSERIRVLEDATSKFGGTAEKVAGSLAGKWQNLSTQMTFTMEQAGQTLAPVAAALIGLGDAAVKGTSVTVAGFKQITDSGIGLVRSLKETAQAIAETNSEFGTLYDKAVKASEGLTSVEAKSTAASIALGGTSAAGGLLANAFIAISQALDILNAKTPNYIALDQALYDAFVKRTHLMTTEMNPAFEAAFKVSQSFVTALQAVADEQRKANDAADIAGRVYKALRESLDSGKISYSGHVATLQEVNRAYKEWQDAIDKTNVKLNDKAAIEAAKSAYKDWAAFLNDPSTFGGFAQTLERINAAVNTSSRTVIGALSDQRTAWENWEKTITNVGHTVDVLTGHTHDIDTSLPHLGTSIGVAKVAFDELGHAIAGATDQTNKFIDAHSSLAQQLASGMTVLTGHASKVRDWTAVLRESQYTLEGVTADTASASSQTSALSAQLGVASTAAMSAKDAYASLDSELRALAADSILAGSSLGALSGSTGTTSNRRTGGGGQLLDPNHPENGGYIVTNGGRNIEYIPPNSITLPFSGAFASQPQTGSSTASSALPSITVPAGAPASSMTPALAYQNTLELAVTYARQKYEDLMDSFHKGAATQEEVTDAYNVWQQAIATAQNNMQALTGATSTLANTLAAATSTILGTASAAAEAAGLPSPPQMSSSNLSLGAVPTTIPGITSPTWSASPMTLGTPRGTVVNIYNPTVTNQSQLDSMVTQIQNTGLNTR
jgi:hypothetical protein